MITEKNTYELCKAAALWQELGYESEVQYVNRHNGASIPILIMPDVGKKNALIRLKQTMLDDIPVEMKYREALKTIHDSIELCINFDRRGYNHHDATLDNIVYDSAGKACYVDLESIKKKTNSSNFRMGHIANNIQLALSCLELIEEVETPFCLLLKQMFNHLTVINHQVAEKECVLEVFTFLKAEIKNLEN